jgi:hypothetical protein
MGFHQVVSCSLEAFWFCYSVLKSPEKNIKEQQKEKKRRNKKRGKKSKRQHRRGFVCVFFSFVQWCFMITMVSRLTSLAQSSLGPTYYHRWMISQLAFFTNVVLVLPCYLLSATYSSTYIPTIASQGFLCQHWYTLFKVADLSVAFPILWSKVRTGKSLCEQVEHEFLAVATPR